MPQFNFIKPKDIKACILIMLVLSILFLSASLMGMPPFNTWGYFVCCSPLWVPLAVIYLFKCLWQLIKLISYIINIFLS